MATGVHVFSRRGALLGAEAGLAALTAGSSAGADDDVPYLASLPITQKGMPLEKPKR